MVPASKEFWAIALSCALAFMVSLGLVYGTLGTGLDLTVGSVPIDTTSQPVQAASVGH